MTQTNEFGDTLDRNGYAPSLFAHYPPRCFLCWRTTGKLDRHEIYGASNRGKSKEYGLWVTLCRSCHERVHREGDAGLSLKKTGQETAMSAYGWTPEGFRAKFGKNYL